VRSSGKLTRVEQACAPLGNRVRRLCAACHVTLDRQGASSPRRRQPPNHQIAPAFLTPKSRPSPGLTHLSPGLLPKPRPASPSPGLQAQAPTGCPNRRPQARGRHPAAEAPTLPCLEGLGNRTTSSHPLLASLPLTQPPAHRPPAAPLLPLPPLHSCPTASATPNSESRISNIRASLEW
jgi:hypothetical protein